MSTSGGKAAAEERTAGAAVASATPAPADVQYPYWRTNMRVMAFATLCLALGFGIINPFLPLVLKEMGATGHLETWVGYAIGGYFGLSFFLTPVWGVVADHYGRKLMVLRTSFGMGAIYLLLPLMPDLTWFLALYLLMGTTNGFVPASQALIATNTPGRYLGQSLSWVQTGTLIGGTVGPALGAVLASVLPQYRHLFWVAAALIVSAGLLALVFAREQHERPQAPFRVHIVRDLRIILAIPGIRLLYFFQFCYTFTYLGSIAIVSVFTLEMLAAQGIDGGSQVDFWVGAVSLALTVASAMAVPLWGRLLDRFGAPRVLLWALCTATLGSLPVVLVQTPWQLVASRFLLGLLAVGVGPGAVTMVRTVAPRGMESRVMAYGAACAMLGIGGGPFIAGQVGPLLGLRTYFALNSVLLLLGFLAWLRVYLRGERA